MVRCERYRQEISACIDGRIGEGEKKELMAHLENCPACRAYYEDLRAIHEVLAPEDVKAPLDFSLHAAALIQAIPQEREQPKGKKRPAWVRPAALAACCALAALGVWGYNLVRSGEITAANSAPAARSADAGGGEIMEAEIVTGDAAEVGEEDDAARYAAEPSGAMGSMEKSASQDIGEDMPEDGGIAAYDDAAMETGNMAIGTSGTQDTACGKLTVSCEDAGAWLEERLGIDCMPGDEFELTGQEYDELCQYLDEIGASYTENDSAGGFFVTITE